MSELKYIVDGRYVKPDGTDLGPAPKAGEQDGSPTEDTRTVAELKSALDAAKIDYPETAKKADLLALAAQHNL